MNAGEHTVMAPPGKARRRTSGAIARTVEVHGILVVVLAVWALVMLIALRHALVVDGWMALVSGREVAQHGLPSHDTLALWTHGRRWTDQQWLAQALFYWLVRVGGIKLVLFFHAFLAVAAVAGAAALAVRNGATARSTVWILIPVIVAYYPEAAVLRPQSFGYPLFVATLWLLVRDFRRPSRRVFFVLPVLALWANLHGSALLGAALFAGAGLSSAVRDRRLGGRSVALLLTPWPCLLVSPYALHLPAYYEKILVGGNFSHFVTEWAPTTLTPSTAPVYLLVLAGVWLIGRSGSHATLFEKLAFLGAALLAFQAVRNTAWLGLTALVVLPQLLDSLRRPAVEPQRLNRLLATAMSASVVLISLAVAAKPASWFTTAFPPAAADATVAAAGPHGTVLAMSGYADWLLWSKPALRGRVAFDARFELLNSHDASVLGGFRARVSGWEATARRYDVFVLDARDDRTLGHALVEEKLARVVFADSHVVVLRRS